MMVEEPDRLNEETSIPPDPPPPPLTQSRGRIRGLLVGLAPAGVILPLAAVGIIIWLLASSCFGQTGLTSQTPQRLSIVIASPTVSEAPESTNREEPAQALSPKELNEQLAEAGTLTQQSKFDEALTIYQELVRQAPEDVRPEVGWAWALILDGQAEQALAHAHRAVELDPVRAETMAVLARAYIETGDRDRALGMAQNAVQLDPDSAEAHAVLAEAYLLNSQKQEAVDAADLALERDNNSAEAHRIRGWLYDQVEHDLKQAARELQLAAGLQPTLWLRQYELGLIWLKAADYAEAAAALTQALGLCPKAVVYSALGEAYYRLGQYERAQSSLQQALAQGAQDANTYALLALTHAREGRCDTAKVYIEQALTQTPRHRLALQARNLCQGTRPAPTPSPVEPAAPQSSPSLSGWIAFPAWNPEEGSYDTYVARVNGDGRRLVAAASHQPAFSPDGQWLAANGERPEQMDLLLVRADGSDLKEISKHIEDSLPCWSPDGRGLVFSSTRHSDRRSRLYIIDQLPLAEERVEGRVLNSELYEVLGEFPAWTADGLIVYNGCDYTTNPVQCGLFALSSEPGPQVPQQLTSEAEDTAPAAYGSQITFMSRRDGNWEIYVINSDGTGLARLTDNAANDGLPTWSPDGTAIAFVSDDGGAWAVWAIDHDGSNRRKLFELGGGGLAADWQHERISWGP